jgi:two-component system, OmpR family, sensor kinase
MTLPLKTRLMLLYLSMFALIICAWSVFVVVLVRADLNAGIDRALGSRASQVALALGTSAKGEAEFQDITGSTLVGVAPTEATAQLLSSGDAVLESSGETMSLKPILPPSDVAEALRTGKASFHTVADATGERFRLLMVRLPQTDRVLVVGMTTENAAASVQRLILMMLLSGPIALLFASVAGWLLAGRALSPVARMTAIADGIGIEALEERVPVPVGHDEISGLARTLNRMLDRLETGVRAKRRLVADASHELQTPLAVMRTELDVSLASPTLTPEAVEVLESAREEADRMARIVRNLLTLARFDEGTLRLLPQTTDLRELAAEVVGSLSVLADESGVRVTVSGDRVEASVDPEYLRVALVNLVENAIKYSGAGATVTVETAATDGRLTLSVVDTGPGIPEESLPRIFDRFYRVDASRSQSGGGSGLGLAITCEIVEAHGGRLEVESRVPGGSRFTAAFPRA